MLFVHITLKDILFFHLRNVKYNVCACACVPAHAHIQIYLNAEYTDISKHLVLMTLFIPFDTTHLLLVH